MATYEFKLPDVGEGIAEAEIVAWHVKPGERIEEDQPLIDVLTDKATVEITSPVSGRVLSLQGEPGEAAAIGSVVARLELDGEGDAAAAEAAPAKPVPAPPAKVPVPARKTASKPFAAPSVRRQAKAAGVALEEVDGTGPEGRITHADLEAYVAAPAGDADDRVERVKVVGLRRRIADKVAEAKRRIPHFSYIEEVDMTELERLRGELNSLYPDRPRLTVLPFIARALVRTLADFPQINAIFDDEAGVVHRHGAVHLGIATQTSSGLIVPVIRHAERLDLWRTAEEIARLAEAARAGKAAREDLSGSTITLTSLGPLGGVATTPVINHPEVAIVGPNRIAERPVVIDGAVVVRKMMNLSCSFDHRVIDGWDAAEFVQRLKRLLETPALIFVEEP